MDKKIFFIFLLGAISFFSLAINGYLVSAIVENSQAWQQNQINRKVLDFRNLFTEKILLTGEQIDFETRLSLETAVRGLNDPEIFNQWQSFSKSKTQDEATVEAKKLLELLIKKTSK